MNRIKAGEGSEMFEHTEYGWFHVSEMREICRFRPEWVCPVDLAQLYPFVKVSRVVEDQRVKDLTQEEIDTPGLIVCCPDGTHLMIDGAHRATRRFRDGEQIMRFYFIPFQEAIRIDKDLMDALSGLSETWGESIDEFNSRLDKETAEQMARLMGKPNDPA